MNMTPYPDTFTFPLIALDETDSTSNYLARLCQESKAAEYTTVTAQYQSAGKGQRGNRWESAPGENLLFSFLLRPTFLEARRQFLLSQITALSVKEELDAYTGGIRIKWPNDIYWQDRKICGMLLENDLEGSRIGYCIAGIGININQDVFHSDAPNPVSLKQITGQRHAPADILTSILSRVHYYYEQLRAKPEGEYPAKIAARYRQALYRREGYHPYRDAEGTFRARLTDVEPDGRFVLEDETGRIRKYLFKEVQYVLNET